VEIDKSQQTLRAYEGDHMVFESRVSTGRQGKQTPNGTFTVGEKLRMHRSRLYHNAPMPFSVQISGNYFIHGFQSVPHRPASHAAFAYRLTTAIRRSGSSNGWSRELRFPLPAIGRESEIRCCFKT